MSRRYLRNYRDLFKNSSRVYLLSGCLIEDVESSDRLSNKLPGDPIGSKYGWIGRATTAVRSHLFRPFRNKHVWKSVALVALLAVYGASCGEAEEPPCHGTYLAGEFTNEEVEALTKVLQTFSDMGIEEPCYLVTFIWSPEHPFRGGVWKDYRTTSGVEPEDPEQGYKGLCDRGYKGLCDRTNKIVYVRRSGNAENKLYGLLIHELLHAVGYNHGDNMKAKENEVWEWMLAGNGRKVGPLPTVYDLSSTLTASPPLWVHAGERNCELSVTFDFNTGDLLTLKEKIGDALDLVALEELSSKG
jgi:hypothetical protein